MAKGKDTTIYLISNDGYRDTICLDCYATNRSEIIEIIEKELAFTGQEICGEIIFDDDMDRVKFQSKYEQEDDENRIEENWYIHKLVNVEEL